MGVLVVNDAFFLEKTYRSLWKSSVRDQETWEKSFEPWKSCIWVINQRISHVFSWIFHWKALKMGPRKFLWISWILTCVTDSHFEIHLPNPKIKSFWWKMTEIWTFPISVIPQFFYLLHSYLAKVKNERECVFWNRY